MIPKSSSNVSRKGKEKLHDFRVLELSVGFDVDGESSGSKQSLDEDFGIPSTKTPSAKKAQLAGKAPRRDLGPCRSRRNKVPMQRLTYDSYVARHYAYMAKIVQDIKLASFEEAVGKIEREQAMDE